MNQRSSSNQSQTPQIQVSNLTTEAILNNFQSNIVRENYLKYKNGELNSEDDLSEQIEFFEELQKLNASFADLENNTIEELEENGYTLFDISVNNEVIYLQILTSELEENKPPKRPIGVGTHGPEGKPQN